MNQQKHTAEETLTDIYGSKEMCSPNLWNTTEKAEWKTGAPGIGSSEACMLGGVAEFETLQYPTPSRLKTEKHEHQKGKVFTH